MLIVTIGGIFIVSILIGTITSGLESRLDGDAQGPLACHRRRFHADPRLVEQGVLHHRRAADRQRKPEESQHRDPVRTRQGRDGRRHSREIPRHEEHAHHLPQRRSPRSRRPGRGRPALRRVRSSCWRRKPRIPTSTSSSRCWRSPTTRTASRSRITSSRRSAIPGISRRRRWWAARKPSTCRARTSSHGSPRRPAASPGCRWSTPSCSISTAPRSTSRRNPRSRAAPTAR